MTMKNQYNKFNMENKNFKFDEKVYERLCQEIEDVANFKLTEFESGLCRAILDIRSDDTAKSPALGNSFKSEIKRFLSSNLIHKDSFKYAGMAVPTGELKKLITEHVNRLKLPEFKQHHTEQPYYDVPLLWGKDEMDF